MERVNKEMEELYKNQYIVHRVRRHSQMTGSHRKNEKNNFIRWRKRQQTNRKT